MNNYLTPVKHHNIKCTNTLSHSKPSDWVCLLCHNLNFSFRKKCNRCKTQTRHQNHIATAYSHYYCEEKPETVLRTPLAEKKNLKTNYKTKVRNQEDQQFPSLSPLVKKYKRKEAQTTVGQKRQLQTRERKELFSNDLWKDIQVRGFQEICGEDNCEDNENSQFTDSEIESLISKILL